MISSEFVKFAANFYLGEYPDLLPKVRELCERERTWSPGAKPISITCAFRAAENLKKISRDVSRLESWGGLRALPALYRIHKGVYPYEDIGHR